MKNKIIDFINKYVKDYQERDGISTVYGQPLVGFADAYDPYIQKLPEIVSPTHELPQNILPSASIIIAYYVPFTKELAKTNLTVSSKAGADTVSDFPLASPQWARAYEETNALFAELNDALIGMIENLPEHPGHAAVTPKAVTFYQDKLISDWSQRHVAYAAGLGTFGINNMLLTKHGCCGRYSTVITDLELEADHHLEEELCLYKKKGTCGICVKNCPTGALTADNYDRFKCYALCKENAKVYTEFGSSYTNEDGTGSNSVGSEVCGKCVTSSPCAFWKLR